MPGLIEQAAGAPKQDASAEAPTVSSADTEGVSEQARPYVQLALSKLYGDNFANLVKMFEETSMDDFPQVMSMAVLGVIEAIEKEKGELPTEILAEVASKLFEILLEDLVVGGVIKEGEITQEHVLAAVQNMIATWVNQNGDRANPEEAAAAVKQLGGQLGVEAELPQGGAAPPPQGGM